MTDFMEILYKRRSIRKFTDEPVSREDLITLLKAGMSGPSAVNARPWEFVVVTEKEILDELRSNLEHARILAPVAICVLGSQRKQTHPAGEKFWLQDCSAATENILLAATALGLGSVWCAIHPKESDEQLVGRILNLPEGVTPLNLIFIGYPAEEQEPRTQYEENRVQWGPFPKAS